MGDSSRIAIAGRSRRQRLDALARPVNQEAPGDRIADPGQGSAFPVILNRERTQGYQRFERVVLWLAGAAGVAGLAV